MTTRGIVRVAFDGLDVTGEERIPLGARIRDVEQARMDPFMCSPIRMTAMSGG